MKRVLSSLCIIFLLAVTAQANIFSGQFGAATSSAPGVTTYCGATKAAAGTDTACSMTAADVTTRLAAPITSINVDGGTIDGTTVGATTPAAGTFTTLVGNVGVVTQSAHGNVAVADMKGQTHRVTGAYTLSLPTAAAGYKAKFMATTAAAFSIDVVTGTDVIRLNGTALTAGNKVTSDGTIYNTIECEANTTGSYNCNSIVGLATDGGA